uniref:Ribosomal RNA-processing protein 8 n=1 Tax=Syphacia muris TaxID=451379 RepID=A0A0N5AVP7_9BILA
MKRKSEAEFGSEPVRKVAKDIEGKKQKMVESEAKRSKRRPWRNKVRKKAAKLAGKMRQMEQLVRNKNEFVENHSPAILSVAENKSNERKRLKRKARKMKMKLLKNGHFVNEDSRLEKLKAGRFRYINEQLYTMSSTDAMKMFQTDPDSFRIYHESFRNQVKKWPFNPVSYIIQWLKSLDLEGLVIADMGCGNAQIASALEGSNATVYSFDLVALNERVTACDMSKVPLEKKSVDIVIFCLSLMGTNLHDYIREANRILKKDGILKIIEVASRFSSVRQFVYALSKMGFTLEEKVCLHSLLYVAI